jgi:hypothetical protein
MNSGAQPEAAEAALLVADSALQLAWLSGDYRFYARAAQAVASAAAAAQASPRSCLVAARLHLTLHRVAAAREAIAQCGPWSDAQARAELEADALFSAGDLHGAEAGYRRLLNATAAASHLVRIAGVREARGQAEEAKALLAEAERRDRSEDPAQRAWLKLRRAHIALHQGRWEQARAIYLAADESMPGWWLVQEHLAEVEALLGDETAARQRYAAIVARTQMPEFMDALAGLELRRGDAGASAALRRQARKVYEDRLAAFPEAASGHALDHFLGSGADLPRALELAEYQYTLRRNGEAAIGVARARWAAGHRDESCAAIDAARAAGWGAPELLWLAARCAAHRADAAAERDLRAQALAINPRAAQMYAEGETSAPPAASRDLAGAKAMWQAGLR